jgi:putative hydrolase of the HAD superfamily
MKKLIVFDAMGVIYKTSDDIKDLLVPYLQSINNTLNTQKVYELYHSLSLGKMSSKEFFTKLGFSKNYSIIEKDYLDSCLKLDSEFIPLAENLKDNYQLAMLSNDVSTWSEFLREKFDLDKYFAASIISSDVGSRKPSHEIYQALLNKTNYKACDCIFIDDNINNLEAAKTLGFNTTWFNRNDEDKLYDGYTVKSLSKVLETVSLIYQ